MRSAIVGALVVVAACDGGSVCLSGNSCPPPDAPDFDATIDARDVPIDAFVCPATDEPNDTIATARALTLPVMRSNLAICSLTDTDVYRVTTTQIVKLTAGTTVSSGPTVAVSILNAGGVSLATGMPINAYSVFATVSNLPTGEYYVRMTGPDQQTYALGMYAQ